MDPPAAHGEVVPHIGLRPQPLQHSISNLDLHVDDYSANSFYRILLQLHHSYRPSSRLRNLKIIRSVSGQGRFRSTEDMKELLHAIMGRTKIQQGSSHPLRMRPLALKSLQLDHVSEQDIACLPELLRDHPSLQEFGLCLWPYRTRRMSSALVHALQSMPKLRHLKLSVLRGSVLGGSQEKLGTALSRLRPDPAYAKLKTLEVSLPRSKQVLSLMAELTCCPKNTSLVVLEELHLQTDAVSKEVAPVIADMIASNTTLEEIQLVFRTHLLDDEGCTLLASALARNKSLTYMGLGPWLCPIKARTISNLPHGVKGISRGSGCQALVETMKQNMTLLSLTFQGGTWPGQEPEVTEEEEEAGSSAMRDSDANTVSTSSEETSSGSEQEDRFDSSNDDTASSSSTFFTNPTGQPKLCPLKEKNDNASFPEIVSFYLELNRCGRGTLLGTDRPAAKEEWIEMLAQQSRHIDRLVYFLSNNPSLFYTT